MGTFHTFLLYTCPSPGKTAEKTVAFLGEWVYIIVSASEAEVSEDSCAEAGLLKVAPKSTTHNIINRLYCFFLAKGMN